MNTAPLADPAEVARRHALLAATPRMQPLVRHAQALRAAYGQVPDADPLDGGGDARLLLLLETPGPAVAPSGFVSADNPTGTGRNLRRFCAEAGLDRLDRLIWNAVPWIIHANGRNRPPRAAEVRDGAATLPPLLRALGLKVAILAGRHAARAAPMFNQGTTVLFMPHPSPTIVCTSPAIAQRIQDTLRQAVALLRAG